MMPNLAPPAALQRQNSIFRLATLALLLLAFGLRAYRLDFQSLWSDEGISLQRAGQALPELLRSMPVEHMPGYFVLLHGWLAVAGTQDFALRFLSLWPSVLAVALIYRVGRELGRGDRDTAGPGPVSSAALAAAALLATGGFQVWYAQEARMYAWLLAAALLSNWALWRLLVRPGQPAWPWGVVYAVATAACVYLHLYGALVPIAQAVFVLGWALVKRDGRRLLRWALAGVGALVLFLPWLPHALGIFGFGGWRAAGNPAEIPARYFAAYTVSDGMPEAWRTWLLWVYGALAAGGLFFWWKIRRASALFLALGVLVPLGLVVALALRNPDYHERYAIAATAPLLLLVAGGVGLFDWDFWRGFLHPGAGRSPSGEHSSRLAPLGAVAVTLLLVFGNGLALQRLYADSVRHKPDFRGAAQHIMADLRPGDVVLVDGPDPKKVFLHYYTGQAPVFEVSELETASLEEAGARVQALTSGARRVWELLYFHAPATVQMWLATQAWATEATDHNGIRVTLYGLAEGTPAVAPLGIAFGPALTLGQAEVNTQTPRPGELLRVTTRWFVHEAAPEYKFSLRLQNAAGEVVAGADYVPQNWFAPTNVWLVGQPAADQRGLLLPAGLPPGDYRLTLRLYDPATGVPVETAAGQDVPLADLRVEAAP
jgi:4-amino-4-deoxy-L-arabinose transferase-like glycosyltransferase